MKNNGLLTTLAAIAAAAIFFGPFAVRQAWLDDALYDSVFEDSLGLMPVQRAGRVMPLSSAAADIVKSIGGRESAKIDGARMSPSKWIWTLGAKPEAMASQPVLRTENRDLQNLLGVKGMKFSYDALAKNYDAVYNSAAAEKSPYSEACAKAIHSGIVYAISSNAFANVHPNDAGAADSLGKWKDSVKTAAEEIRAARLEKREPKSEKLVEASQRLERLTRSGEFENEYADEVVRSVYSDGTFRTPTSIMLDRSAKGEELKPYAELRDAVAAGDELRARGAMDKIFPKLRKSGGIDFVRLRFEHVVNELDPFFGGFVLYAAALLIFGASVFMRDGSGLRRFAGVLLLAGICAHSFGLAARMYIQARPPVTNLYSSVVFAGAIAAAAGFFIYARKDAISAATASALAGFLSLLVAMNLPHGGDTMGMMRAVLNSNFWLTVHVVTIMIGYCGVFLAGFLASMRLMGNALLRGNFGERTGEASKTIYAVMSFALFFSFAGTMLGGIWADMSWGRFWGWDPKENGALMTVLWCAAALHAKRLKLCSDRIFLAMAVFGNIVAAWAWFGVNLMGVGLHAYGFIDGGWKWFFIFIGIQLLIVPLGFLKYKAPAPRPDAASTAPADKTKSASFAPDAANATKLDAASTTPAANSAKPDAANADKPTAPNAISAPAASNSADADNPADGKPADK